jgi:hypothetical protein
MARHSRIATYPYKYRSWYDEEHFDWVDDVAIELVEHDGGKLWRFPDVGQRFALLEAIEYRVSGAEGFVKSYLELPSK